MTTARHTPRVRPASFGSGPRLLPEAGGRRGDGPSPILILAPCDQHGARPPAPMGGRIATLQIAERPDVRGAIKRIPSTFQSGHPRAAAPLSASAQKGGLQAMATNLVARNAPTQGDITHV